MVRAIGVEPTRCYPPRSKRGASAVPPRSQLVLPASLELASPPYQSGDLPHDREERIGAGCRNRTYAPCLQGKTSATKDKPAWCWRQESNPQPFAYDASALPLCYASNFLTPSETSALVGSTDRRAPYAQGRQPGRSHVKLINDEHEPARSDRSERGWPVLFGLW